MTKTNWNKSLLVLLSGWLTIALLPLGVIAILQTQRVAQEARESTRNALIARTETIAQAERAIIEHAFATSSFLQTIAGDLLDNPAFCSEIMQRFTSDEREFSFVAIVPISGIVSCSSENGQIDTSSWPFFEDVMRARETFIGVSMIPPMSDQPIFNVVRPYEIDGTFAGMVNVSVPYDRLSNIAEEGEAPDLIDVITISERNKVLASRKGIATVSDELPAIDTVDIGNRSTFTATSRSGQDRQYVVIPFRGGPAAVVGVWDMAATVPQGMIYSAQSVVLPVLMWVTSLAVALIALHALVLRHLQRLRGNMDQFAATRIMQNDGRSKPFANEMRGLEEDFIRMADIVVREEANVENRLHERESLLREIHHRVKNNLQLIASLMNMQKRRANHEETRRVLEQLQDRILSLAIIHKDLQEDAYDGVVDVGALISDLVQRMTEATLPDGQRLDVALDLTAVNLVPDQAVPLSFIVAEAMTNVMKYVDAAEPDKPWLRVSLDQSGETATLVMENSIGSTVQEAGSGTGGPLIKAFAVQMDGSVTTERDEDSATYVLTLTFPITQSRAKTH